MKISMKKRRKIINSIKFVCEALDLCIFLVDSNISCFLVFMDRLPAAKISFAKSTTRSQTERHADVHHALP